jgi:aminoethylphosphonate catabolism LysR family transcriptional regulator
MRYTQLRSFHAVATAGGFNAAAEAFHISQPTLTTQVGALEEEYGLELFIKKGRRRELTSAGRQLLAITARLFAEEEEAITFLEQSRELKHGKLSIGAVGPYHVTEMLAAFNRAYPGIELAVKLGNSTEVLSDLLEYKSDIAVLAHIDEDDRLLTLPYRRHPVAAFMRTEHRLARHKSIKIAALQGEPLISRERGSTTRRAFEQALAAAKITPRSVMEIGSREAIREAVIRGIGISYVSVAEFVPDPCLRLVQISDAAIYTYAHVVILRKRETSRIIRAFLEVVQKTKGRASNDLTTASPAPHLRSLGSGTKHKR